MKAQPFRNEIMVTNAFPLCRNMNVYFEVKKSFKGESLTFVGLYPMDFRHIPVADVREKLFYHYLRLNFRLRIICQASPSCLVLTIGGKHN